MDGVSIVTAYASNANSNGVSAGPTLLFLALGVLILAAMWQVFVKAKRPGWFALIPFYNLYALLKMVGRPGWWFILFFIPFVNIVVSLVVHYDLARTFGKGIGYTLLLVFLPFIGWPMLAWGDAKYKKPKQAKA